MIAFIALTQYHAWNSIVMAKKMFPDERCDIYVYDGIKGYADIIDNLKKEGLFEDVLLFQIKKKLCEDCGHSIIKKIKRLACYIGWRSFLKKYVPIKAKQYTKVFIAGKGEERGFLLSGIKRFNPEVEPIFYEDGAYDYLHNRRVTNFGKKGVVAKLAGLDLSIQETIEKSYVLSPECVYGDQFEYFKIPTIDTAQDVELKNILNRVFEYKEFSISEKLVYLYNPIPSVESSMNNVIKNIADKYGYDDVLLKDHPRLHAEGYEGIKRIPKEKEVLWECMCMNNDFSDKILISHCSTALFTPKFIFDQEPVIIFLFNMLKDEGLEKDDRRRSFEEFVNKIRKIYRDGSRVFLPNTEEELYEYLEKVMNKNG